MFMRRDSQMDIFQKSAEERFVDRTAEHIRGAETLDAEGLDDASLKERVKIGISRARSQGLSWESSVTG